MPQTRQVEWNPKMNNIYAKNRYSHGHIQSCECDPSTGYVCIDLHIAYCIDQYWTETWEAALFPR